jgi:phospholipid transport system substrate-binding protein
MKLAKTSLAMASLAGFWMLCLTMLAGSAGAEEALLPPQLVIQHTSQQLQTSLQKPEYKSDFSKATHLVDEIIEAHVDFDRVAMLILGKYWKTASPDQQTKFKREFRTLLVRTYTTAFTEYSDWTIRYLPLKMEQTEKRVIVRTEIVQPGAPPVGVNYRMVNLDNDWKVYDVLIDGISLIQNYRTSFTNQIARTGSMDQLIGELAQRNSSALKEPIGDGAEKHGS